VDREIRNANSLWGAPRIHGELLKARHRDQPSDSRQIHGAKTRDAFADVAQLYAQSGRRHRRDRYVRRGIRSTLRFSTRQSGIHHTFTAGSRLQVDITSSNFPRRVRNTNSGNPIFAEDTSANIRIATNAVHHNDQQPSFLAFPVVPVSTELL
jgi:predicted acyl esterase